MWFIYYRFLAILKASVPHFYLNIIYRILPEGPLNIRMDSKDNVQVNQAKLDADLMTYSLSNCECDYHAIISDHTIKSRDYVWHSLPNEAPTEARLLRSPVMAVQFCEGHLMWPVIETFKMA